MPLVAATWALAAVLGATGTVELGLRAEARGLAGGLAGARPVEPVPWQLEPTLDLAGLLEPRLAYTVALAPTLLLLAAPEGGRDVRSASGYYVGSTSLTWRAGDRTTLALAAAGSRGTLAMSPLSQLTGVAAAGGAGPPGSAGLDPAAGVRTGAFSSASLRTALDWRATRALTLGGTLGASHGGGLGEANRLLFPTVNTLSADAHGALALTPLDGLALVLGYTRTRLAGQGTVGIADALTRWSHRVEAGLEAALGAGMAATVEDDLPPASSASTSRLAPRAEASLAAPPPADRSGLGFSALLGYAPFVDPFTRAVRPRLSGSLALDWRLDPRRRLSGVVSGASAVGPSSAGQGVAAAELGGWYRWDDLEAGLTARAGYQEATAGGGGTWQWSAGVATRWRPGSTR